MVGSPRGLWKSSAKHSVRSDRHAHARILEPLCLRTSPSIAPESDCEMVTPNGTDVSTLTRELTARRWDLVDHKQRDAWMLTTQSVLFKDENVRAALEHGPPTAEKIMSKSPGLTKNKASAIASSLLSAYASANKTGYELLIPRISFDKRPATAAKVGARPRPQEWRRSRRRRWWTRPCARRVGEDQM